MAVVGCAIEVTIKQLLEEVDIGTLRIKHRLPIVVVLDDFLAAVGADAQANSGYLVTVVAFYIVRLDIRQLLVDSVLDGFPGSWISRILFKKYSWVMLSALQSSKVSTCFISLTMTMMS